MTDQIDGAALRLRPGIRLGSTVSAVEVVVVRAPGSTVTLTCAGRPMVVCCPSRAPVTPDVLTDAGAVVPGKRYVQP
ncbi:MAG: hypothetical protein JWP02_128, partial [Acidimicrobiales bacterium]|nr:hypothetical protein [Acidimicrobiales bacterium]